MAKKTGSKAAGMSIQNIFKTKVEFACPKCDEGGVEAWMFYCPTCGVKLLWGKGLMIWLELLKKRVKGEVQ